MMNARVLQKWTIGYTRQSMLHEGLAHCLCELLVLFCAVVSELGEVLGVAVESVRPTMFGEAHQVRMHNMQTTVTSCNTINNSLKMI